MRRSSADPDPVGKSKSKDPLRRRITFPGIGSGLSLFGNGQVVSDVNVVNGNLSPRLESRKSDVDSKSLSADSSASFATAHRSTLTGSSDFDLERTKTAIDSLNRKIHHTMNMIQAERQTQAENVNEYLESVKSDRPNSQHMKSAFEKKNQKSTQTIMTLQGKLETYQKKLADVQTHGSSGPKDVLKNVSHSLKTMVTKPAEFASMLKHKFGSTGNVSTGSNEEIRGSLDELLEESQAQDIAAMSPPGVRKSTIVVSDALDNARKQDNPGSKHSSSPSKVLPLPADRNIVHFLHELEVENNELRNGINALKVQMQQDFANLKQTLDMEREFCERLEEQINDMTELHQHEMTNVKQEMASAEEKLNYILEERTRDLHELLDSCVQRVSKVEQQQQHQQLNQTEGSEGSSFSIAKIINFILAFLSFCLIVLSTIASLVSPFLSTRLRYFLSFLFVVCSVLAWKNWDFLSEVVGPWLPEFLYSNSTTATDSSHYRGPV